MCVDALWQLDAAEMHVERDRGRREQLLVLAKQRFFLSVRAVFSFLKWREKEGGV